jgi:hypothetical protein
MLITICTFFKNGGAIGLAMDNIPVTYKQKHYVKTKKVNENEHKHRENVEERYINHERNKTIHTHTHNM